MKIFSNNTGPINQETNVGEAKSIARKAKLKKGPQKIEKSETEIREKLAVHREESNINKLNSLQNSKKMGEGFLNSEIKPPVIELNKDEKIINKEEQNKEDPNTKDYLIKSDVGVNSPKDPLTKEKLKSILDKGAFNFSSKERDVLSRIVGE
jgi:hypothetical protein